ncbi:MULTISPECIES: hypothetical protein [Clostridium]|uniref:hypothetical protein n=1 Tax=Clostridium TaxID=1485 RepID=UPI000B2BBC52|nr:MULTISPECIES: hypothetical protein [Clostridium]
MRILKMLFSKKFKEEYSRKIANDYNEINNRIEEIYTEAITEYNKLKEQAA